MPRAALAVALAIALALAAAGSAAATVPPGRPSLTGTRSAPVRVALHSRFHFGSSRSRGYGFGGLRRARPRHSLLHRAVKTAIWLYVLHLFFTHGGLSVLLWIVVIALVVSLVRRRRRRDAYRTRTPSFWP
jgi:hypothetical protein